jgi:hypothetical protein
MRKVTGGDGSDTTNAVKAWLAAHKSLWLANMYMIGELDDPDCALLTDYESPLIWPIFGNFLNTTIKRGTVTAKIGLEVSDLSIDWSPKNFTFLNDIITTSPYQRAYYGAYDDRPIRVWTCYMPTPGDANTFGCSELFGGRVGDVNVERAKITFTVNSFLDVVNQRVPGAIIEITNSLAQFKAAIPPPGLATVPQFDVIAGSTTTTLIGDCTSPTPHQIFNQNLFSRGFVVFNRTPGSSLGGLFSPILGNFQIDVGGTLYQTFRILAPLPWDPIPGVDTFYVSMAFPLANDPTQGPYYGFPFVPPPETAV